MKSYIFITKEGYTFQPESDYLFVEPDIENCQVIGFAVGKDETAAFNNLIKGNDCLIETNFDELICIELKYSDYWKHSRYFYLEEVRPKVDV